MPSKLLVYVEARVSQLWEQHSIVDRHHLCGVAALQNSSKASDSKAKDNFEVAVSTVMDKFSPIFVFTYV